jgi:F0F1-type ATP synthase membrane subunit b/b'
MQPPNYSLIIVMVCFWLTFWLVQRFLLKPVGQVLAERHRRIDDAETEWQAKHQEFLDETARLESELEEAARTAAAARNEQRQAALDRRQSTLDAARQQADGRLDQAMSELETEAASARADLQARARELARVFAGQLLGREVSQ